MPDNEIIGRTTCPVCGCAGQDVKINKNKKLYMFCDNGCAVKWNSSQSRRYLPVLAAGKNCKTETGLIIQTLRGVIENERQIENIASKNDRTGIAGSDAGRRTDGRLAGAADNDGNRRTSGGWLAGIFGEDTDGDE